jgi:uncharacterized membrane protein YedE/YeeE
MAGCLFGVGLVLGRMSDPVVVLGFLDVFGQFDPTLALVFCGAVGTTAVVFPIVLRRERPVLDDAFQLPTSQRIDRSLLVGAAVFGVGWGLAGYCPGPALVGSAGGIGTALVFVPAMVVGSLLQRMFAKAAAPSTR